MLITDCHVAHRYGYCITTGKKLEGGKESLRNGSGRPSKHITTALSREREGERGDNFPQRGRVDAIQYELLRSPLARSLLDAWLSAGRRTHHVLSPRSTLRSLSDPRVDRSSSEPVQTGGKTV